MAGQKSSIINQDGSNTKGKKRKSNKIKRNQKISRSTLDKYKKSLHEWVDGQLKIGNVLRLSDIYTYAKKIWPNLEKSKKLIRQMMIDHPSFQMSIPQQRPPHFGRKRRVISTLNLGMFHGDIGYFSVHDKYPTPPTYRSGFLVLIDVLSRLVYIEILPGNKIAATINKLLAKIIERHKANHDYPIRCISFDKERSVISRDVQAFLKDQNIDFRAFQYSSSKSKMAENTIGRIRVAVRALEIFYQYKIPWWRLLDQVENTFNHSPIIFHGKQLVNFTPASVTEKNKHQLLEAMRKISPAQHYSLFKINSKFVNFKFKINDKVKVKTVIISSSVLGPKKKVNQLSEDTFKIIEREAYFRLDLSVGNIYTCVLVFEDNLKNTHVFDEEELVKVNFENTV